MSSAICAVMYSLINNTHCYCQKRTYELLDRDMWLRILIRNWLNSTKVEKNKRKFIPKKGP